MVVSVTALLSTYFAQGDPTPAQIPLTKRNRLMNGDPYILNGLEGKINLSHAAARTSQRPVCCPEGSSRAREPWTSCARLVPLSDGRMGPERRGNRIHGCAAPW